MKNRRGNEYAIVNEKGEIIEKFMRSYTAHYYLPKIQKNYIGEKLKVIKIKE